MKYNINVEEILTLATHLIILMLTGFLHVRMSNFVHSTGVQRRWTRTIISRMGLWRRPRYRRRTMTLSTHCCWKNRNQTKMKKTLQIAWSQLRWKEQLCTYYGLVNYLAWKCFVIFC